MDRKEIYERLTPLCREAFSDIDLELKEELDATTVDNWTSLTFLQLLDKVEHKFGFKFKMAELLRIHNIGNLVDVIVFHQK